MTAIKIEARANSRGQVHGVFKYHHNPGSGPWRYLNISDEADIMKDEGRIRNFVREKLKEITDFIEEERDRREGETRAGG
jgi:hypothetical protein